jgi:hypothetical protein
MEKNFCELNSLRKKNLHDLDIVTKELEARKLDWLKLQEQMSKEAALVG